MTAFLIEVCIYGSIDVPKFRGFGLLEKWYFGTQVTIVFCMIEYGILLAAIKYKGLGTEVIVGGRKTTVEEVLKIVDLVCFFSSITCCLIAGLCYLGLCLRI